MSKKLTITTIVKKADECVVYQDDGWYCSWSKNQTFNFDLIAETKANTEGIVLLVSEEEFASFKGETIKFDDHEKWVIPKYLIWMVYGKLETETEEEAELVEFMRGLII